jgi:thiosulfate reductase cytochrome b subunit
MGRRPQPLLIRLTHWLNIPLLLLMAGSGLQIWVAYPRLGPRGSSWSWFPLQAWVPPSWMRVGDWLAGARHVHFAVAWLFIANGLVWTLALVLRGEWRRRLFWPPRDLGNAVRTGLHYLRIRKQAPEQGLYNGLQRLAYTSALALGILVVASGLAIWKPVQLRRLAWWFGGYDGARAVHFLSLAALALFVVGHVVMVAIHWRTLGVMITGGRREP